MFGGIKPSALSVLPSLAPLTLHKLSLVVASRRGTTHTDDDIIGNLPGSAGGRGLSSGGVCRAISGLNERESITRLKINTYLHVHVELKIR